MAVIPKNRPNGKISRATLQTNYRVINTTQGLKGRSKNYQEFRLCCHLGIDYAKATKKMPYRNLKEVYLSENSAKSPRKSINKNPLHERGPFVTLVTEVFQIAGITANADGLVREYMFRSKKKYQVYIIADFDKMMERYSSVLSNYPTINAILLVEMNAYFVIKGQLLKTPEGSLKRVPLPSAIDMKDFLKNGSWEINENNKFKVMRLINRLTDQASLPKAHTPKKITSWGF